MQLAPTIVQVFEKQHDPTVTTETILCRASPSPTGAKYVADTAGAYWLLDEIALAQRFVKEVAAEEFQVWKLTVNAGSTATLVCEDGILLGAEGFSDR